MRALSSLKKPAIYFLFLASVLCFSRTARCSSGVFNVIDYGAKGDGKSNDAGAIQRAIDACSKSGGRVLLPAGKTFYSGAIYLKANVDFHVEKGAILLGSADEEDYGPYADALINAVDADNISITGGGQINGNASAFIKELRPGGDIYEPKWGTHKGCPGSKGTTRRRYMLITVVKCDHLKITDITLKDAASWFIHPVGCDDVLIDGVSVIGDLRVPNNDGIDPDHCRNVRISNCFVHTGDDAIVFKNTLLCEEWGDLGPCENITVTGCVIVSRSSALKIDEVWNDCRNIVFDSCVIYASNRGICIQSRDRGNIENIIFSNMTIDTQLFSAWWWGKAEPICITHMPREAGTELGRVRNITFSNIICNSENSIYIHGWKGNPVEDIVLDNVKVTIEKKTHWQGGWYDPRPGSVFKAKAFKPTSPEEELNQRKGLYKHKTVGVYCENAKDLTLRDVQVRWGEKRPEYFGSALETHNVEGLVLDNFKGNAAHKSVPDRIIE
ncbi:MAG: glycoside hydrolase family 28 protein [Planctomycetes bacterium]|nr:glycoside hydrolase family 28 protein [Planctomycetota bacterium]